MMERPATTPISFVLADNRLVTVRYATPKPVRAFEEHVRREPELVRDARRCWCGCWTRSSTASPTRSRSIARDRTDFVAHIFHRQMDERRIPAAQLTALLTSIGRTQTLLTKIRYSAVSTIRMLSFLAGSNRLHEAARTGARHHLASLSSDVTSLSEHASFLSDNLTFLLDASLGLISIEQNAAMKLFSWAAVVFLPPT